MSIYSRFARTWKRLSFIRRYVYKYRKLLLIGAFGLGVVNFFEILLPIFVKNFVDSIGKSNFWEEAKWCIVGYFSVSCVLALSRVTWRLALSRGAANVGDDIRVEYFESLLRARSAFFAKRKSGDLLAIAGNDVEAVRFVYDLGFVTFFDAVFWLITIPAVMFYLAPLLAFYVTLPMIIIPVFVYIHDVRIHAQYKSGQSFFGSLTAWAQESLVGSRVIKSFAHEHAFVERYRLLGQSYVDANLKLAKTESTFAPSLDAVMLVSFIILLGVGGSWVIEGSVSLGTLVAFTRYIQQLTWPMAAVGYSVTFFQKAMVSSERIIDVIDGAERESEEKISGSNGGRDTDRLLDFSEVGLSYDSGRTWALKGINLSVRKGEKVALIGEIGGGKSSLLALAPRLMDATEGHITAAGCDIREWDLKALRKEIAYVPQEAFLFSATIEKNILYGVRGNPVERSRLEYYADLSDILSDIRRMPEEFLTQLGERGINLSGGQRQRISIARALSWGGKLLILDDALSAVDMQSESRIIANLAREKGDLSWLYATHRLSSVMIADRIVVMKEGRIIQEGTHRALSADRNGWYWRFYEEQRLEEEMEAKSRDLSGSTEEVKT